MSKYNPNYTDEFREQIVQLYNNGKTVSEISREYKISKTSVSNWVKYAKNTGSFSKKANISEEDKELIELRKEVKQVRMENDLLKQAALILGRR